MSFGAGTHSCQCWSYKLQLVRIVTYNHFQAKEHVQGIHSTSFSRSGSFDCAFWFIIQVLVLILIGRRDRWYCSDGCRISRLVDWPVWHLLMFLLGSQNIRPLFLHLIGQSTDSNSLPPSDWPFVPRWGLIWLFFILPIKHVFYILFFICYVRIKVIEWRRSGS